MKIQYFCPLWGSEHLPFEEFCDQVAEAGYDGVETYFTLGDQKELRQKDEVLKSRGLGLVAQHWQTTNTVIKEHLKEYRTHLEWLVSANPQYINSQTGRDWFSMEDNQRIIAVAKEVEKESGIKIVHETHRGKFSFCAARTREFLEADPELRLTVDFSHWCNVSESLLEDQQDAVGLAVARADHVHARVGHAQGPQVSDPRAPEFEEALNAHLAWWDQVVEVRRAADEDLTFVPEFGPSPYLPAQPYTLQPLADQWDINVYMMKLLKARYS
ncbi:TIM barrel protein [Pontiellaceae bacterium B12227]|nr:TIM barrel protein [Pontiellaceae bacterium B12227]